MMLSNGVQALTLDGDNDRLYVLHDISKEAVIYRITRPSSPQEPLFNGPQEQGRHQL